MNDRLCPNQGTTPIMLKIHVFQSSQAVRVITPLGNKGSFTLCGADTREYARSVNAP